MSCISKHTTVYPWINRYQQESSQKYRKNELFKDALNCFDKVLVIKHDHYDALNKKGFIFQKLKRWEEAEAAYELAMLADNKNFIAFNNKWF